MEDFEKRATKQQTLKKKMKEKKSTNQTRQLINRLSFSVCYEKL